jgi:ABC-type antimicrobial peptide transport system permease subunit
MMEIGNGISTLNQRSIASLGANNLMVRPGQAASGGVSWGAGSIMTLTPEDCDAIATECPAIRAAAPQVSTNGQIVYGNRNWVPMQITGTTPDYLDVRQWPMGEGSCFTDQDVRNSSKVCIIGTTIQRELFGNEDPIGKDLRLANVSLRVVGVLSKKGATMFGSDQDDVIMAPWTTIKYRISGKSSAMSSATASGTSASSGSVNDSVNSLSNLYPSDAVALYPVPSVSQQANTPQPIRFANINSISAAATSTQEIPLAIKQITQVLRERHHLRDSDADDFQVQDMTEFLNTLAKTQGLISTLLLIVATISLVVGGVGIMNIMLVSVTERTREIGLRMAVGARARHILWQFLVEAIVLCLAGGLFGILLGRGSSLLVRMLLKWPTAISIPTIIASVVVSGAVGIIFGYYPAWKASRLDPIEALRYE